MGRLNRPDKRWRWADAAQQRGHGRGRKRARQRAHGTGSSAAATPVEKLLGCSSLVHLSSPGEFTVDGRTEKNVLVSWQGVG